jgi:ATP-dependent exoDNAse (exonuclease V) alpha subunit
MPKHLSIRVPWHDNNWNGTVCKHPEYNQACRFLRPIALSKDDDLECSLAGKIFVAKEGYMPPCLRECGAFMSNDKIESLPIKHPYVYDKRFGHIDLTPYCVMPYSFIARPYAWTLRENAKKTSDNKLYNTHYDSIIEVTVGSCNWVSNGINQKNIFDYFYRDIVPNESMVIAYAKTIPFIETPGRVIIGMGMVMSIEDIQEYKYTSEYKDGDITSFLWERQVGHSIRESRENGFVFPFNQIEIYLRNNPKQLPDELIVMAPDGYFNEFSYATEHLSHDALILTLNKTIEVLQKYQQIGLPSGGGKDWPECIRWCKERLDTIWKERGLWPGLGNVLQALGLPYGHDIASAIRMKISDGVLWDKLPDVLAHLDDFLPEDMKNIKISKAKYSTWKLEMDTRLPFLKLLSRINLSLDQAQVALDPEKILSSDNKPHYSDYLSRIKEIKYPEIIKNPYLLYEQTRLFEDKYRFSIGQLDVAMFPAPVIDGEPIIDEADDERRLRALIVSTLENSAQNGSTFMIIDDIVKKINVFRSDVKLEFDISKMTVKALESFFKEEFSPLEANSANGEQIVIYQLNRFASDGSFDGVIRRFVQSKIETGISAEGNWEDYLNTVLKRSEKGDQEDESRNEKLKAIKIMAESKISVLTGGAGTGKTTTLAALCLSPEIQKDGIIILAPTGKARVVLDTKLREAKINCQKAYTVFQFLQQTSHCDYKTYKYYLSGKANREVAGTTVIIDECSMLTEEMFGALAESLLLAKRIVFVGDPNQLPPIGAGKPFFDLVDYLHKKNSDRLAKLTVSNRQKSNTGERLDVELAKMFTYDQTNEVGDDIYLRLSRDNNNLEFVPFNDAAGLYDALLKTIVKVAEMTGADDITGFDESLGGSIANGLISFKDVGKVDNWQILSPYRNDALTGSLTINRQIHDKYKKNVKGDKLRWWTENPLGNDGIIYGDKVINIRNQAKTSYPKESGIDYVANGEIGFVNWIKDNSHQLVFSSQPMNWYYFPSIVTDGDSDLELAYALTVHKAQGSGFGSTILIINEPPNGVNAFISREMIYTALTRQSNKIYILYNKEPAELRKYSGVVFSDIAKRLTNLFETPIIRKYDERYYSDKLIHITRSGEPVRSKSEVIIYNELDNAKVPFIYEKLLVLQNGKPYSPDFTIYNNDGTVKKYWEHLGMLSNFEYREKQKIKLADYAENGISEENGNLIITKDEPNGSIDSLKIATIVKKLLE